MKKLNIYAVTMLICGVAAMAGCQKNGVTPTKASNFKSATLYTGPDTSGGGTQPPVPPGK